MASDEVRQLEFHFLGFMDLWHEGIGIEALVWRKHPLEWAWVRLNIYGHVVIEVHFIFIVHMHDLRKSFLEFDWRLCLEVSLHAQWRSIFAVAGHLGFPRISIEA